MVSLVENARNNDIYSCQRTLVRGNGQSLRFEVHSFLVSERVFFAIGSRMIVVEATPLSVNDCFTIFRDSRDQ